MNTQLTLTIALGLLSFSGLQCADNPFTTGTSAPSSAAANPYLEAVMSHGPMSKDELNDHLSKDNLPWREQPHYVQKAMSRHDVMSPWENQEQKKKYTTFINYLDIACILQKKIFSPNEMALLREFFHAGCKHPYLLSLFPETAVNF